MKPMLFKTKRTVNVTEDNERNLMAGLRDKFFGNERNKRRVLKKLEKKQRLKENNTNK